MTAPVVKVCCIANPEEAELAVAAGAAVLGLVSQMPSGPGVISDAMAAAVCRQVRQRHAEVETFLLTALTTAAAVAAQHAAIGSTAVQLVDRVPLPELQHLRELCPGVKLVQVVHVMDVAALDEARTAAPWVDALLLDSGNPRAPVKQLGGTGRRHDWAISRRIRDAVAPLPLFLAGGLSSDNVAAAIGAVQPHGLDLCSALRSDGRLDAVKLDAFFRAVRAASTA